VHGNELVDIAPLYTATARDTAESYKSPHYAAPVRVCSTGQRSRSTVSDDVLERPYHRGRRGEDLRVR